MTIDSNSIGRSVINNIQKQIVNVGRVNQQIQSLHESTGQKWMEEDSKLPVFMRSKGLIPNEKFLMRIQNESVEEGMTID
jgi:uncharacterized protein YacL (UPF0231 family)